MCLLSGGLSRGVVVRTRDGRVTSPSSMEAANMQKLFVEDLK